jgi:hypothetical protein
MEKITADFLLKELKKYHEANSPGWVFMPEVRYGTGYRGDNEKRIDAWAIQCWKFNQAQNLRRAFEIKISRSDIRHELLNPDKRWNAYAISNEFYFVAPEGLFKLKELERVDGLIEWIDGKGFKITKPAKIREGFFPRWSFVASIARDFREREKRLEDKIKYLEAKMEKEQLELFTEVA